MRARRAGTISILSAALAAALQLGVTVDLCAQSTVSLQPRQTSTQVAVTDASQIFRPLALDDHWRMHSGDDPAFANPNFDDSSWQPYNLNQDIKSALHGSRPEIIWYRLHIKVSAAESGLALEESTISRAAEVYVNGELFTREGQIQPFVPTTWNAQAIRAIPDRMLAGGVLVIAVRAHISQAEWNGEVPGLSTGNLVLGEATALRSLVWLTILGDNVLSWIDHIFSIIVGVIALVLFASQRRQKEYLWIAALGILTFIEAIQPFIALFQNMPLYWEVASKLMRVATPYLWAGLYFSFIHVRIGRRWQAVLLVCGFFNAFSSIEQLYFSFPLWVQFISNLPFILLLMVVIPFMLAVHARRGNREAAILLIPALLFSLYIYAEVVFETLYQFPAWKSFAYQGLLDIDRYPAGPFAISLDRISNILSSVALAVIMLVRSARTSRRQAILEGELAAAQQVQQVLLPDQMVEVPGFLIESVYQPAQQVGGDFFQIVPSGNGGLLLVVGDVAGKGLPAAMLVSVLVGAIRTVADYTRDPAELLASLNERLIGRTQGSFSTALAAHITADGWVTIANAGHLSPYLDGKEVELAPALPLGILPGIEYQASQFHLHHASRLTFYSDGVVEAQNAKGELLGFDRARDLSLLPAADIVRAAQNFGQEDDITVVTISRDDAMATAA